MKELPHLKTIKVTISDPNSGEVLEEKILTNDFTIITCGNRYIKSWQLWGTTCQVNIAKTK